MATKPSEKPRWATTSVNNGPSGGANVLVPSSAIQDIGWLAGEKPPREYFNWLARRTYEWVNYFETVTDTELLKAANNLSDLASAATARTNLGLGTAATASAGTFLQAANNLSDLASPSIARTNLGLGSVATLASSAVLQAANNLSEITVPATARTNLGLGTAATFASGSFAQTANNLSDLASAATARTNLGLGTAATLNTGTSPTNVLTVADADVRYAVPAAATTVTSGISRRATDTEAKALVATDLTLSPSNLLAVFSGTNIDSVGSDGYQRLPSGLIIQWGSRTMTVGNAGAATVTLPITFPSTCLCVMGSVARTATADSGDLRALYVSVVSTSSIKLVYDNVTGSGTDLCYWFAIGI